MLTLFLVILALFFIIAIFLGRDGVRGFGDVLSGFALFSVCLAALAALVIFAIAY